MTGPEQDPNNNNSNHSGQRDSDWSPLHREEGGNVHEAMRLNTQRPDQNPVNPLNTTPGVPAPAPTPVMSQQAQQPGRQNSTQDVEEKLKAKSYASPMIAFVEGFLGAQNDQLEKVKEPKEKAEDEEAKRIAEQKAKLQEEESVDEDVEDEEMRQALEEQRAEEEEQLAEEAEDREEDVE